MASRQLKLVDRNRVINDFYLANLARGKEYTVRHFITNHGMKRATLYRALEKAENIRQGVEDTLGRRPGSGRPKALTARQERQVLAAVKNKKGPSTITQARRYDVHQTTIQNVLHRQGAKAPKRQKAPEINAEQLQKIKDRATRLSLNYFPPGGNTAIVIDDESFFTLRCDEVRGNDRIWTRDISTCPPEVRFKQKGKFAKKLLVHAAISPKGISELSFVEGGYAVNRHVYMGF